MIRCVDSATRIRIFQPGATHILVFLHDGVLDTELAQFSAQHNTVYASTHDQHLSIGQFVFLWWFRPVNVSISKAKLVAHGRRILRWYRFAQAGTHHSDHQGIIKIC